MRMALCSIAAQHRLELFFNEDSERGTVDLEIYPVDATGDAWEEYVACYRMNSDGSYSYRGSCFPGDHDMPAWIASAQAFRKLIPEFARVSTQL